MANPQKIRKLLQIQVNGRFQIFFHPRPRKYQAMVIFQNWCFRSFIFKQKNCVSALQCKNRVKLDHSFCTPIPVDKFETIARAHHKGSSYFINVSLEPTDIKGAIKMVTPAVNILFL